VTTDDLTSLGIAYAIVLDMTGKGPTGPDDKDLASALADNPRVLKQLQSGEIVFVYNTTQMQYGEIDSHKTVLAYAKEVAAKGGPVLMFDGKVVEMSAADFKKATIAKPKGK